MEIIPVTKFRRHALETIRRVNRLGEEVTITTKGRPTVVLVSYDEWESIVETLAIKQDPQLMSQLAFVASRPRQSDTFDKPSLQSPRTLKVGNHSERNSVDSTPFQPNAFGLSTKFNPMPK